MAALFTTPFSATVGAPHKDHVLILAAIGDFQSTRTGFSFQVCQNDVTDDVIAKDFFSLTLPSRLLGKS